MPRKRKSILGPFVNKAHISFYEFISKAVMDLTRLRNKFLKNIYAETKLPYNRQRNYCVSLTGKSIRDYYNNLDNRNVTDKKLFWKIVKSFFCLKITLIEEAEILGSVDHGNTFGALLTDPSKTFDCLPHAFVYCKTRG